MIFIKNYGSVFGMADNKLRLLDFSEPVEGVSILIIDGMVHVETLNGNIPIYMFKMDKNLQRILHEYYDIWNS